MTSQSYSKTQYDNFAPNYSSMADLPGEKIAARLLRQGVRDVRGLDVLDLAGGSGLYARMLVEMGASHVVSVDVSSEMVQIGREIEAGGEEEKKKKKKKKKRGGRSGCIEFHVADCSAPLDHLGLGKGAFDLVMGNWLFNCAGSKAEFEGMWRNVSENLKPGGRFVGLMEPLFDFERPAMRDPRYGLSCTVTGRVEDGVKEHIVAHTHQKVEFDGFVWDRRLYEKAQTELGLTELDFQLPAIEHLPEGYEVNVWKEVLKAPYCLLCTAAKKDGNDTLY